jgi:hypothetical protein
MAGLDWLDVTNLETRRRLILNPNCIMAWEADPKPDQKHARIYLVDGSRFDVDMAPGDLEAWIMRWRGR